MDAFELQLDSLCKSYPLPQPPLRIGRCNGATAQLKTKKALAGVSLNLSSDLYGLLAPNGAGQSTLIHIITGTLAPDSGEFLWCGKPATGIAFRRTFGYMPQQQGLYNCYSFKLRLCY